MYRYIVNPTNKKKYLITSNSGRNILKNYLNGGAVAIPDTSLAVSALSPMISSAVSGIGSVLPLPQSVSSYFTGKELQPVSNPWLGDNQVVTLPVSDYSVLTRQPIQTIDTGTQSKITIFDDDTVDKTFIDTETESASVLYQEETLNYDTIDSRVPGFNKPTLLRRDPYTSTLTYEKFDSDLASTGNTVDINGNTATTGDKTASLSDSPENVEIFTSLTTDLNTLHDNGIAHGDIHNGNIVVKDGVYMFSDFGLTKTDPRKYNSEAYRKILDYTSKGKNPFKFDKLENLQHNNRWSGDIAKLQKKLNKNGIMSSDDFELFKDNYVEYLKALAYDIRQIQILGVKLTY